MSPLQGIKDLVNDIFGPIEKQDPYTCKISTIIHLGLKTFAADLREVGRSLVSCFQPNTQESPNLIPKAIQSVKESINNQENLQQIAKRGDIIEEHPPIYLRKDPVQLNLGLQTDIPPEQAYWHY